MIYLIFNACLHFLATVLFSALLLSLVFRRSPIPVIQSFFLGIRQDQGIRKEVIILMLLIVTHLLLVIFQKKYSFNGVWNLTESIFSFEQGLHPIYLSQKFFWLNYFFSFCYFIVFPSLPLVLLHIFDFSNHHTELLSFFSGLNLCLLLSIPCFCLFEVNEVWMTNIREPFFAREDFFQNLLNMRSFNLPGNCLPSLHTSITVITLLASYALYFQRLFFFMLIFSFFVIFSIIFLGIHWYVDVFGGILLGIICHIGGRLLHHAENKGMIQCREC